MLTIPPPRDRSRRGARMPSAAVFVAVGAYVLAAGSPARGAENLALAPGLSFVDDSSAEFPIRGDDLGAVEIGAGRAAVAFFGTAHCWNTNREAERLVALYPKFRDRVSFVVVDVGHPSEPQRPIVTEHYHGYIPTVVVFTPDGKVLYSRSGETASRRGDTTQLEHLIAKAINGS